MHGNEAGLADIDAVWELRVQLCRDIAKQPIEDPTVKWKQEDTPSQRFATVTVRHQDSWAKDRVQAVNEEMRFSVWTGLAARRPLGNINRARKAPYEHSAKFRERSTAARFTSRRRRARPEAPLRKLISALSRSTDASFVAQRYSS